MIKPVVFIPGYPASKLKFKPDNWTIFPPKLLDLTDPAKKQKIIDLLSTPKFNDPTDDVVATEPIRNLFGLSDLADSLYAVLEKFGYDFSEMSTNFRAVGWDWRKGLDDSSTQQAVETAIDDLTKNGGKVVVLPHSTGGLILRKLLEDKPALSQKIDEVIAFGVPWCGTLPSLRAITQPGNMGFGPFKISAADVARINAHAQAAYDLFPPNPATTENPPTLFLDKSSGQPASPLIKTSWIKQPFMNALAQKADQKFGNRTQTIQLGGGFAFPPVTNVVGWGAKNTLGQCDFGSDGSLIFSNATFQQGDGTNPLTSVEWLRGPKVRTMYLPIGAYPIGQIPKNHPRIWDSPPVLQLLSEALEDAKRRPFVAVAADADDFQDATKPTVLLRLSAADEKGEALKDCVATLRFSGSQKIEIAMDTPRKDFTLKGRGNLKPNVNGTKFFRLPVDFKWKGGKASEVVIFHVT